jgi:hypothetical protein
VIAVLASALLGLGLAWIPAVPVHAALHGPVPADASGDPNDQFTDQDALFAYVLSDTAGGRICVVPATGDPGGLSCDSPAPGMGSATHVLSIGTYYTLVKNAPMRPGAYRLLVEDSLNTPGDVSDVFTVTACSTCARTPDAAVVAEFKAAATAMAKSMDYTCVLQGVLESVAGKAIGLRGISKDITVPAPAYPSSTPTFAMSTGASTVLFTIQDPSTANINKALDILKDVACGTALMYHDQANDPPDPNFGSVVPPVFTPIDTFSPPELDSAIRSVDRERGVGRALLHDFERYQGATAATNRAGQILQLNAAGQNASDLAREIQHTATLLRTWADVAAADPELAGVALSSTDAPVLEALYARVRNAGFLAEEITQFHALGYTDADIASIRTHASLDLSQLSLDTPYPEMLRSVASDLNAQADHYDQFSSEMFVVAARIEGANGSPVAGDDLLTTAESGAKDVSVLANDTDPDGDPLAVTSPTPAAGHGTVACTTAGVCTYTPAAGYNGPDGFDYGISDGRGGNATGHVTVTVTAINHPPVASDDSLITAEGSAGDVSVLANDTDPDGDPLAVTSPTPAADHGTVACTTAGVCTYTPAANYNGPDGFDYGISDGRGGTATGHVSVTITAAVEPTAPLAHDDLLTTSEDTAGDVSVLTNDTDPNGDVLTVTSTEPFAGHGTVACTAAGACTYTPAANYNGPDSFEYGISDGNGGTATGHVTVTVNSVNDSPTAASHFLTTAEGNAKDAFVLADSSDPDRDSLTVTSNTPAAGHGTVACTAAGVCTYTPDVGYHGPDNFDYDISDGQGGTATGHVTVTVTVFNESSTETVFDTDVVSAGVGGLRNIGSGTIVLGGVTGKVTKALLFWQGPTGSENPLANAAVSLNAAGITGTNIGFSADNCWGYGNSQAYRADVTGLVSGNGNYELTNLIKGDADISGASLIVFFNDGNSVNNRDVVLFEGNDSNVSNIWDADGWNTTLSGINYSTGSASLELHVGDGQAPPDGALLLNARTLAAGGPIFSGDSVPGASYVDGNLWDIKSFDITSFLTPGTNTLNLTTGMNTGDCLSLVVAAVNLPSGAAPKVIPTISWADPPDIVFGTTLSATQLNSVASVPGTFAYTPAAGAVLGMGANQALSVTFTPTDSAIYATATATVHINVTPAALNGLPVATGDALSTAEDTAGGVSVLANDTDPDGDSLSVTSLTPAAGHGSVACTTAGVCTYTPAANFNGADGFDYVISDGHTGTATGHVTVTVTAVNDLPVATATVYNGAKTGTYSDPILLGGKLVDTTTTLPLAGRTLSLRVGTASSSQMTSAGPTNSSGSASVMLPRLLQDAGNVQVTVDFAGDGDHSASSGSSTIVVSPDSCTLAYTGATLVAPHTKATLKAQLADPDLTQGDLSGHTVAFNITGSAQPPVTTHYTAVTNASGVATIPVSLTADSYAVGVSFAGDHKYAACDTVPVTGDTLVTVGADGTKVTGGGWAVNSGGRFSFGFNLIPQTNGTYQGQLQLRAICTKVNFHGRVVTSVSQLAANKVMWLGTGSYNGQPGATFSITVVDVGSGSKSRDTIALVIRNAAGKTVFSTSGSTPLKGGNITVTNSSQADHRRRG